MCYLQFLEKIRKWKVFLGLGKLSDWVCGWLFGFCCLGDGDGDVKGGLGWDGMKGGGGTYWLGNGMDDGEEIRDQL